MKNILLWTPTIIMIIFFIIIAFMSYSEWWNVAIANEINKYAWGEANENSWFYKTPQLYSNIMLIEGLIMTCLITFGIRKIYKRKTKFNSWFLLCFVFFIMMLISGNIS